MSRVWAGPDSLLDRLPFPSLNPFTLRRKGLEVAVTGSCKTLLLTI
jgi:hypothetical protein